MRIAAGLLFILTACFFIGNIAMAEKTPLPIAAVSWALAFFYASSGIYTIYGELTKDKCPWGDKCK